MRIRTFFVSIAGWIACFAGYTGGICTAGEEMYPRQAVSILETPPHVGTSVIPPHAVPAVSQTVPSARSTTPSPAPLTINGKPVPPREFRHEAPNTQRAAAQNIPSGMQSGSPSGMQPGTPSGMQSGTPSGMQSGTPSGMQSGSPSGMQSGTPSGMQSGSPSGMQSGTPSGMQSAHQTPQRDPGQERSILVSEPESGLARNAGDQNAGDQNAGDQNAGDQNAGDQNAGDQNAGDQNAGDQNAGDQNAGDQNAGDQNAGDQNAGDRNAAEDEEVWRILPDGGPETSGSSVPFSTFPENTDGRPAAERQLANGVPMEMVPELRTGRPGVPSANGPRSILEGTPAPHLDRQWTVEPENAVGNSAERAAFSAGAHSEPRYIVAKAEPASELEKTLNPHTDLAKEREEQLEQLKKHNKILKAQANVVKLVAKIIRPSVVHIRSDMLQAGKYGEQLKIHDEGSGIIICRQKKFYVLTNQHVIKNALPQNIEIRFHDNRITNPIRILYDQETDIAVLELAETDLIPAALGDSNQVDIGDFVLAVGSPFGLDNSVTFGIVSAIGRRTIELASNVNIQDFIQTDAAINPGNSGGPLLNLNAEVIGMNTAIASNSGNNAGIAFSIPIRMAILVADQLILYGKTRRAYLGVNLEKNFTMQKAREIGLERPRGALVTTVLNPSPASQAKFRKGDLILEFNGTSVEDDMHLYNLVNLAKVDKQVTLKVYREGEIYEVNVKLWER